MRLPWFGITNTCSSIDRDCMIEQFCSILHGVILGGEITIGQGTLIGVNIIQQIKTGENVVIGAGSTVIKNIGPNNLADGVPSKEISKL